MSESHGAPPAWWAGLTARHSRPLAVGAVVGAFGAVLAAFALWPEAAPQMPSSPRATAPTGTQLHPQLLPPRARCETCGVIESIRQIEAKGDAAASYEFAVRLPDGTLRYSRDPQPGRWQVGDAMQLIGGGRAWSSSP
ncbi:hypothetical protein [Ramlibacter pallidus]|uniref:DUF4178 domain-containing protein n=1 Tax=Ramlibacter pallidus TaxID=2780087 RepID=A0ABR9S7L4_9BURK|nr:hypothetical protein [Ramlibacter pallidus]MBE7369510.1 hypothetical protein [Ramlibacter pallidus]